MDIDLCLCLFYQHLYLQDVCSLLRNDNVTVNSRCSYLRLPRRFVGKRNRIEEELHVPRLSI